MTEDEKASAGAGGEDANSTESEIAALRERTEYLEHELAEFKQSKRHRVRATFAVILIVIGGLLVPTGIAMPWLRSEVLNTDRFVETFAPLADSPQVQAAAADAITNAIMQEANVEAEVKDVLPDRAKVLAGPITSGVETVVRQTTEKVLASEQFRTFFKTALREAHKSVVALLRNEKAGAVNIKGGTVTLDLQQAVELVVQKLSDAGLTFIKNVPTSSIKGEIVLFKSDALANARTATSIFVAVSWLLPFLAIFFLALGIIVAPDRRRGVLWAAIALFLGAVVLGATLALGRNVLVDQISSVGGSPDIGITVYNQVVARLRDIIRGVAFLGLVIAAVAFFSGTSKPAVQARAAFGRGAEWVSGRVEIQNPTARTTLAWVHGHRRGLQLAVVGLGAAWVLFLTSSLSAGLVLWTTFFVVLGLIIIEVAARAGAHVAEATAPAA
ncbi:MAG: hypothetical protein ACOYNI_02065 [Acidimicrobiia bacterium]